MANISPCPSNFHSGGWKNLYQAAVMETDWSRIEERIQAAESAMKRRLEEISSDHGGTSEENLAIANAFMALEALRADVGAWKLKQR
jgi:hypothetical protein